MRILLLPPNFRLVSPEQVHSCHQFLRVPHISSQLNFTDVLAMVLFVTMCFYTISIVAGFILSCIVILVNADGGAYQGRDGGGALFGEQLGQSSDPARV